LALVHRVQFQNYVCFSSSQTPPDTSLGSIINNQLGGRPGMLLWGLIYGLFLGAGIGALLSKLQKIPTNVL
jgi:hypothetical protein